MRWPIARTSVAGCSTAVRSPDIFMAARLGDPVLAARLIEADPSCVDARVNEPGYGPVPPFNIYCWSLGFGVSPHAVAQKQGHADVVAALESRSSPRTRLRNAIFADDAAGAKALLAEYPALLPSLTP